jgi:small subunit ribosomal protein S1
LIGKRERILFKAQRAELERLYNNTFKLVEEGEVVMGTIVAINKREVVVNYRLTNQKVIINANEFRTENEMKVGDKVEVFVEKYGKH